jgi:pyruvate dehydrogenase E1 component alpha subunit
VTQSNGEGAASPVDEVGLYERMLLIRRVEERLAKEFHAGNLPGAVHLYIGQEAVAVGMCSALTDADWITGTHRGHGHFLAKGGDPKTMVAEIYGKENGCCRGMGGSMHVTDLTKGMLGANGIVGAGLAITLGAAWVAQRDGKQQVAVCFFGDGASNQGVLMETMNIATLWGLPMIFMCEHNMFSEFSPASTVTAGEISDRARAFGMPVSVVDGNDVLAVSEAAAEAVKHARAGNGPSFIEAKTYRIHGHIEAEIHFLASSYREEAEIDVWRKSDPIDRTREHLLASGAIDAAKADEIEAKTGRIVDEAFEFAVAGKPADENLVFDLMFVDHRP